MHAGQHLMARTFVAKIRPSRIEVGLRNGVTDARGNGIAHSLRTHFGINLNKVVTRDIFTFDANLGEVELDAIRREFTAPVTQVSAIDRLRAEPFDWLILVGFKPGVTDNVGRTARFAVQN